MVPLKRAWAGRESVPNDLMAEYYTQRASAGLIGISSFAGRPNSAKLSR
jgi:2,4-dienoyl-CoA reductase-like NADH-dependent reductase (Old Yellow Enzyme family)